MKAVALLSKITHTSFIRYIVKCIEALLRGKCFRYFSFFYWADMKQKIKIISLFSVSIYRHSR